MPQELPQSYDTHRKFVPAYHLVASALLLAVLVYAVIRVVTDFGIASVMHVALIIVLTLLFWYTRSFALGVQDRVIRLEERLRLGRILPDDLRPRIEELSTKQLIALRFAADGEVADLVRRVLDGSLTGQEEIKRQVKSWRADHCRV
jgi:hypothetical protein